MNDIYRRYGELTESNKFSISSEETFPYELADELSCLLYTKVIYKMSEISRNAERVSAYKARKEAVNTLTESPGEKHLWACVIAFQNYPLTAPWLHGKVNA